MSEVDELRAARAVALEMLLEKNAEIEGLRRVIAAKDEIECRLHAEIVRLEARIEAWRPHMPFAGVPPWEPAETTTDDIVTELRAEADVSDGDFYGENVVPLLRRAADEIERLRGDEIARVRADIALLNSRIDAWLAYLSHPAEQGERTDGDT